MRKAFLLMLFTALFTGLSCTKDNVDNNPIEEQIIGTWDATYVYLEDHWLEVSNSPKLKITATFRSDGSYYGKSEILGTGNGKYKVEGNTIKTYIDGELYLTYNVISIESDIAEITISDGGESLRFRFKKR